MADLTWAVDLALDMIDDYGMDGKLIVFQPVVDPTKPDWEQPAPLEVPYDCRTVFVNYEQKYIDNVLIHTEDRLAFVAAKGMGDFEPNLKGEIRVDHLGAERAWKIISTIIVKPAEQIILYKFQVRR